MRRIIAAGSLVNVVNDLRLEPTAVAAELRPVVMRLSRELRREAHALGVTGSQATLLFSIKRAPGLGVRELASQERISAAAVSGYVSRLEKAGLVERTPHPTDRRRHGLTVSGEGDRVLRSVMSRRTAWLAARLKELQPAELAAVERAIEPLARLLEEGA
jgi:DNA-binding MarR family transcriptional regulator